MLSAARSLSFMKRGLRNYLWGHPLCASFEITRRCNARCKHCHLGGPVEEELAAPERYGEICRRIRPVAVLVSGGEPLLRKNVDEIISALHTPERAPYIAMTTNGWLLTRERYLQLRRAGVDRFSVSLDYPDERHDEFRGLPGLFERIRGLIGDLDGSEPKAINISSVVQRHNFRDLKRIAELGAEWDVRVNFSTYTPLRTGNEDYLLRQEDLPEFKDVVSDLIDMKKQNKHIRTSDYVFGKMIEFFETGGLPDCQAGKRYFVVNPDGTFSPCGLIMRAHGSLEELRREFTCRNTCDACYTSLRADCERPLRYLATDTIDFRM